MSGHIAFTTAKDCANLEDSYGVICTHCNACGRYSKATMLQDRLAVYKSRLEEEKAFNRWIPRMEKAQRKNKQSNVADLERLIRETGERIQAQATAREGGK